MGIPLRAAIWPVGAAGIAIRLLHPYRFERASLALYPCMGWMLLPLHFVAIVQVLALPTDA